EQQLSMGLARDGFVGNGGDCEPRSHRFTWRMSALWPTRWMNCCSSTGKTRSLQIWLGEHIPDTSLHLPGFHLMWAELSGKTRGGGICFYINKEETNLSHELPCQTTDSHIKCPTRDTNILDHCYTTLKDAYRSVPQAALGVSDHCLVHLIPTYRQKLKSAEPVVKTVRRWTTKAKLELQACFD
ncbi:hypothetical protein L3Q82_011466, partial [Scortum barcoo]